jgi:hypothetical protein
MILGGSRSQPPPCQTPPTRRSGGSPLGAGGLPSSGDFVDPDHLRIASDAFDTALRSLDGRGNALSPHRVRHLLASFIIERVMDGDKDAEELALQAVESLDIIERASA